MTRWSVVACDQFSSEPAYWEAVERTVGDAPSALRLMLPEVYLDRQAEAAPQIDRTMVEYLSSGVFRTLENSYIYLQRRLPDGGVRQGLLGLLDLEQYDYGATSVSPVRATEGTIEERLPPRVQVRRGAALEMPHILVFIDDPAQTVIQPLAAQVTDDRKVYDFELMEGGGHITGWQVDGALAQEVDAAIARLSDQTALKEKYGTDMGAPVIFAMGDGNHSLATAKRCWEELKPTLKPAERETHPARFSLVELVNLHDPSIGFEPIHRVIFDTDPAAFIEEAAVFWATHSGLAGEAHTVRCIAGDQVKEFQVCGLTIGETIAEAQALCDDYAAAYGGHIDYIHGDDTAAEMASRPGCAGILLPKMEKEELFPSIMRSGAFPKKSFSIGHARDKRYYLECRKIK